MAIARMRDDLAHRWTIGELAADANMSPLQVSRIFNGSSQSRV